MQWHYNVGWYHCAALILLVTCYGIGVFYYSAGYLMTRKVVNLRSNCKDFDFSIDNSEHVSRTCYTTRPRFLKAVIVIIDALRFDFVAPTTAESVFYQGQMPFLRSLLIERSQQSLLFPFVADPPTTTLQRLKGLTTGSLPTFIDAASNFGSSAIDEDNWVDQSVSQARRVVFLGDDTWISLFPDSFIVRHPFPSFDVKDLHTVDNGILDNIWTELDSEWDILIAHFLGVDHCGHRYGPDHPEMSKKLQQMDVMIKNITEKINSDTVLFVLGDHGMTKMGDHGGDTDDEVDAALFVYTPQKLHSFSDNIRPSIPQIDFVPTVSLLLGVPIPYSNLGRVIPELFSFDERSLASALESNLFQVQRFGRHYLETYGSRSLSAQLGPLLDSANVSTHDTANALALLRDIRETFKTHWVDFNVPSMIFGIGIVAVIFLFSLVIIRKEYDGTCSFALICVFLHAVSFFSNSYVVYEDNIARYFLQTLICIAAGSGIASPTNLTAAQRRRNAFLRCLYAFIACCSLRVCMVLNRCREEQWTCVPSLFVVPFASLKGEDLRLGRFVVACICLWTVAATLRWFLKINGHLGSYSLQAVCATYMPYFIALCISFYWMVSAFAPTKFLETNYFQLQILPPCVTYVCFAIWLALFIHDPLLVNLCADRREVPGRLAHLPLDTVSLYKQFKEVLEISYSSKGNEKRLLFGLASGISGPMVSLVAHCFLIFALLLGDGMALGLLCFVVVQLAILELGKQQSDKLQVLTWSLLSSHFFYAFGHHASFSAIPWHAAFVGVSGNFRYQWVQAVLVSLHVFSAQILCGLTVPLVAVWNAFSVKLGSLSCTTAVSAGTEADLLDTATFVKRLWKLGFLYISVCAVKLLAVMVASAVHRRHLMAWKIFAPKFIFEGLSFFASAAATITGCLACLFVYMRLRRYLDALHGKR